MLSNKDIKRINKKRPKKYRKSICYAPSHAIVIEPNGYIKNCCLSQENIGKWPDSSISEIIEGNINQIIRDKVNSMQLPFNCINCATDINIKKDNSVMLRMFDNDSIIEEGVNYIGFSQENTCNLKCMMCNSYKSSSYCIVNKSKNYYGDDFFNEIKPYLLKLKIANFTGGEPFLIKSNFKIWDFIIKNNPDCLINIVTNGTVLNDNIKDVLERGKFHITVSIDSLESELFEKIRLNSSFNSVMKNLEYFIKYSRSKNLKLNISTCPMQINYQELQSIGQFTKDNNLGLYLNPVISPYDLALWPLPSKKLRSVINYLEKSNPFSKYDESNIQYCEFIDSLKIWRLKDKKIANLTRINSSKFLVGIENILLNLGVFENQAKTVILELSKYNEMYFTKELNDIFKKLPMHYFEIINSKQLDLHTINVLISNYIYYSIFS